MADILLTNYLLWFQVSSQFEPWKSWAPGWNQAIMWTNFEPVYWLIYVWLVYKLSGVNKFSKQHYTAIVFYS